jgi:SAM-dependent methyltransferase
LAEGARVLEVGCFVGAFLDACAECGWLATGVDIGEETSEYARRKGHTVLRADLREVALPRGTFDAVFIWNTFDQVDRPGDLLDQCRTLLRARGRLVLRIPNGLFERAAIALRRDDRQREGAILAQEYNNFLTFPYLVGYSGESLRALLESHGLAVECVFGDTIQPLATASTMPHAIAEEAAVKRAVMRQCRQAEHRTGVLYYPWLDVIARNL